MATAEATREFSKETRELGDKIGVTGSLINQIETTSKSVLKQEKVSEIIALCESSLKSKRVYTKSKSAATPPAPQVPCTSEGESGPQA